MAVIDSYSESNQDDVLTLNATWGLEVGQTFDCSTTLQLSSAQFYLKKNGSPTGNMYARIFAHTGTYGTDGIPTGAVLATSDAIDASTLTTSFVLTEFTFSGAEQITLTSGQKYVVLINHANGGAANYVIVGADSSAPSHGGNSVNSDGTYPPAEYYADNTLDACFYVNGEVAPVNVSVVETTTVSESKTATISDPVLSVVDTVAAAEYSEVFAPLAPQLYVSVNDAAALAEDVTLYLPITRYISVTDATALSESFTATPVFSIYTDPVNNPKLPVFKCEGRFGERLSLDEKLPVWEGSGYSGSQLDEKLPVFSLEGTVSSPVSMSLDETLPQFTVEAFAGSELDAVLETLSCEAESYSVYIELDKKLPVFYCEGSAYEEVTLALDKKLPFWTIEASAICNYAALDAKLPAWYMSGSGVVDSTGFTLDEILPEYKSKYGNMTLYDGGMTVDAVLSAFTMSEDTGIEDTDPGELSYADQFEDYTLEYVR